MLILNLPEEALIAISILEKNGHKAYAVGGCVRDIIMGLRPHDVDITTTATPEKTLACFCDYKTFETGRRFGTIGVNINHNLIEITTHRSDIGYSDMRHPDSVVFSKKLSDDLTRRDFCCNAMAYSPGTGLADFFGGLDDIKNKILRTVGNPEERFREDPLRILRALRFSAAYGFSIEQKTAESCEKLALLTRSVSRERITSEFKKLLLGDFGGNVLNQYKSIICATIPDLQYSEISSHNFNDLSNDFALRLSYIIFSSCSTVWEYKSAQKTLKSCISFLKLSAKEQKKLSSISLNIRLVIPAEHKYLLRRLSKYDPYTLSCILSIRQEQKTLECLNIILKSDKFFTEKTIDITGEDLIKSGFSKGEELGRIKRKLLRAITDGKVENEKARLTEYSIKYFRSDGKNV